MSSYRPNKLNSLASFLEPQQDTEDVFGGLFAPPTHSASMAHRLAEMMVQPPPQSTLLGRAPTSAASALGLIGASSPAPANPYQGLGMVAAMAHMPARTTLLGGTPTSAASALGLIGSPPQQTNTLAGLARAMAAPAPQSTLLAGFPVSPWMHLVKRFKAFLQNLELTSAQVGDGLKKFHGVASCLNTAYYGHNSPTANAFLIGSWGKNTKIRPPRDVDLYFVLPIEVYNRFERYSPGVNKQSALLQEVKGKLLATYPSSSIRGDGPVVLAGFTSYNVEVVPVFLFDNNERSYYVTDTKNGGSYKKTMPHHEVGAINDADSRNSSNVRPLVRMLKAWQACCQVPVKSFYLELMAGMFLDQYEHRHQGLFYYDWIVRDFFKWMIQQSRGYLLAPGTYEVLSLGDAWKSKADSALARAVKACEYEKNNDMERAGDEWQKIFGNDIPKWV